MSVSIPQMRVGIETMNAIIGDMPSGIHLVEVGVFAGESSEAFLRSGKVARYTAVDDWRIGYDPSDSAGKCSQEQADEAERRFRERMRPFAHMVEVLKMSSAEAAEHMLRSGQFPDMVYIDAGHLYEYVKADIARWRMVLNPSGARIISGHDYEQPIHPGVKRAVDETFAGVLQIKTYPDTSWMVKL